MPHDMVTIRRSDLFVCFMLATGHQPDPDGLTPFAMERIAAAIAQPDGCPEILDDFDTFWQTYPRRTAKKAARKAWDKAIKDTSPAVILAGAERFRDHWANQTDRQFIPYPATWLNAGSWDDELIPRASTKVAQTRQNLIVGLQGAPSARERLTAASGQRALP